MPRKKTTENPLGLDPWEGEAVSEIGVNLTAQNAVLNRQLEIDTVLIESMKDVQHGDIVHCVVELTRGGASFVRAQKHDGWKLVGNYSVTGAAVVSADLAHDSIQEQRDRVEAALEAAKQIPGQTQIPGTERKLRSVGGGKDDQKQSGDSDPSEEATASD